MKKKKKNRKYNLKKSVRIFLDAREKVLNSFKNNIFTQWNITSEPTPEPTVLCAPNRTEIQTKTSRLRLSPFKINENFENEIRNNEKKINNEIFIHNSSFLIKKLHKANQAEN